jgi:hypothetical protein
MSLAFPRAAIKPAHSDGCVTLCRKKFGSPCVVPCVVPVWNVSWMLFQEGWSSKPRLRRGVGQDAHNRSNPHVKCTGVYCA